MANVPRKTSAIVIAPPKPANEAARLEALKKLNILDTEDDEVFDAMTRAVKRHLNVPIVLVSLIDENRQWFKSCIGLEISETSRDVAFCAFAILSGTKDVFVIPDAHSDERFYNNPLVTSDPYIRFYAGAPLLTREGYALGTLCVIDRTPRILKDDDLAFLQDCATVVVRAMELRAFGEGLTFQLGRAKEDVDTVMNDRGKLLNIINCFQEGFVMWNDKQQIDDLIFHQIVFFNDGFLKITGMSREQALQCAGPDVFICAETDPETARNLQRSFGSREACQVELVSQRTDGRLYWNCLSVRPIFNEENKFTNYYGTLVDHSERKAAEMQMDMISKLES
ncbi:multi-sensor hybrid histidine kinase [Planoprotostelium fungivorum]|uniref:Multi-sensor hybrid histidine kinase n=1 Tax=Planoprotostelium fungivorum TaxID=1890364 RepID=A0A2P6N0Q7_9EUKA|nr:multi-sensor hybrid histidine kinase [Planoprotostelium fungivorum]